MKKLIAICIAGAALTTGATAQTLVGRTSNQRYSYVYGASIFTVSDTVENTLTSILDSDGMTSHYDGVNTGIAPGNLPFDTSVELDMDHQYTLVGNTSQFSGIYVHGGSGSETFASGAIAGAGTTLVNRLTLEFDLDSETDYNFIGNFELSNISPNALNYVSLQRFNGIVWTTEYTSLWLPGQVGGFDVSGTLDAGLYRIDSQISIAAGSNEVVAGAFDYNFQAVPEPITMFAIAPTLMLIARKRKRKRA